MRNTYLTFTTLIVITALAGCTFDGVPLVSSASLLKAQQSSQKASDDLNRVAVSQAISLRSSKRALGVAYFIEQAPQETRGNEPLNLDPQKPEASFANYLCAGTADSYGLLRGSAYVGRWNQALGNWMVQPPDTLRGQAKALIAFSTAKVVVVQVPDAAGANGAESRCREDALKLLQTAVNTPLSKLGGGEESPALALFAIYDAIKGLGEVLETLAKDGTKVAVEIERRRKIADFIKANSSGFKQNANTNLKNERLQFAWDLRRAATIYRPYLVFRTALSSRGAAVTPDQQEKLRKTFDAVDTSLAEFDAMAATASPTELASTVTNAHDALADLVADNKVSLEEIAAFLTEMADMVGKVKSDWDALPAAAAKARDALK